MYVFVYAYTHIYIYIHTQTHVGINSCMCIHIYMPKMYIFTHLLHECKITEISGIRRLNTSHPFQIICLLRVVEPKFKYLRLWDIFLNFAFQIGNGNTRRTTILMTSHQRHPAPPPHMQRLCSLSAPYTLHPSPPTLILN